MAKSGVYQIVNQVNGKRYIGSSIDIKSRWRHHKCNLRRNCHANIYLQRAWNKYGKSNFKFEVICLCSEDKTREHEQYFMDKLSPEYNIAIDAKAAGFGRSPSKDTIRILSIINKGKNHPQYGKRKSKETKRKISKALTGIPLSKKHREKLSKAHKGKRLTEEHKRKISESLLINPPFKNKHHTEKSRQKISESLTGKRHTNETKRKMSEAHKGKLAYQWIDFTDGEINEMKALREAGHTYKEIGIKYGVSRATIRRRIAGK